MCNHPLSYVVDNVCLACLEQERVHRERQRVLDLEARVATLEAELLILHKRDVARSRTPNEYHGEGIA